MKTRLVTGCSAAIVCAIAMTAIALLGPAGVGADSATAVSAGGFHTCALTPAGAVKCWGQNDWGQLGNGTMANSSAPVDVVGLGGGVAGISAGGNHTCALLVSGGVKCWGSNSSGQLGNGSTSTSSTPVDVLGLSSGATQVSAGGFHTCAVVTGGGVKCWGKNNAGQLGDGSGFDRTAPVDVVGLADTAGVSAGGGDLGGSHTCAWTTTGVAKCWGRNDFGQLGNNTTGSSNVPVDVTGLASGVGLDSAGRYHSCALLTSGAAQCWGWNSGGQLGNGTTNTALTPVGVSGLGSGVTGLDSGGMHGCAVTGGGAKCWGFNFSGELGNGTSGSTSTVPVEVRSALGGPPLGGVIAVSAGGSINTSGHTCAVMSSGAVKCWGENSSGQLGDGTLVDRLIPVDVIGFAGEPPTATPTDTPSPTNTLAPTDTPMPTSTSTPTDTPTPTRTTAPTNTPEVKPTETPTTQEQLGDLQKAVLDLGLPKGTERSLANKLEAALRKVEQGRPCAAANQLGAFVNELRALVRSGRLPEKGAGPLINAAKRIAKELCP